MARYTLTVPDYDIDAGEFISIVVEANDETQARQEAEKLMPLVAWECADCTRMRDVSNGERA